VHPEETGVQEQIVELDAVEAPAGPGLVLSLICWQIAGTADLEIAA
jgi:hypothetical protein